MAQPQTVQGSCAPLSQIKHKGVDPVVPIIDFGPYFQGRTGALKALAEEIKEVNETIGFMSMIGHDIERRLIDQTFEQIARFFAQPMEEKLKLKVNRHQIGYIPPKASVLKSSPVNKNDQPDTNEAFVLKRERTPDDPDVVAGTRFCGMNQWPDNLPGFKEAMLEYHTTMADLGRRMLPVYAVALGLREDYFDEFFTKPHYQNRNAHYAPGKGAKNQFGLAPHIDHSFLTLLPVHETPGLQIKTMDGVWFDAPYVPEAILVNTGETLQRWSNGRFIATPHGVQIPKKERYAIPMFFNPNDHAVIDPTVCVDDSHPQQFDKMTFNEFQTWYFETNYPYQAEYGKNEPAKKH